MKTTVTPATLFSAELSTRLYGLVHRIAALPDVKAAVEANHDENRWWPTTVADPRMRMAVAGWSARVSYHMINTYVRIVTEANIFGFDRLAGTTDSELAQLVAPLGLGTARIRYLRSLAGFLEAEEDDILYCPPDALIDRFASTVNYASFKIAQCAVLYSRGYHCGIIPVDSGMVTKLAPALDIDLPSGPVAHEWMRQLLQACVCHRGDDYRKLINERRYAVTIPPGVAPSWWLHLVLIYFKRLHLNRPDPRLCTGRPLCEQILDCPHANA